MYKYKPNEGFQGLSLGLAHGLPLFITKIIINMFCLDYSSFPALLLPFRHLPSQMATHFSILAWKIPWIGEPGGLQSMGSPRVRHE